MSDKIMAAKAELAFDQPFFASLLMKRPLKAREDIPTMAVDKSGNIYYNPQWVETLERRELMFVMCHEVMHMVCMHALRQQSRDPQLWNIAGDFYINSFLTSSGVGSMPKGALFKDGSEDKTTEEIYNELFEKAQKQKGKGQGKGKGNGDTDDGDGSGNSDPSKDPLNGDILNEGGAMSEAEAKQVELQVKLDVADAARVCRERGRASGALERMVNELLTTKMKWYEVLEKYFSGFTKQNQSWERPNRRFTSMDIYLPINAKEPSMGTVVIGVDTSGSIGPRELQYFGGHLNAIVEQCRPEKVIVVYCDSAVSKVEEFTQETYPVELHAYGGGGTDMRAITQWIEDNNVERDVCCILTDGWTPFPQETPCSLVWAITESDETPPCGEVVKIDMEE